MPSRNIIQFFCIAACGVSGFLVIKFQSATRRETAQSVATAVGEFAGPPAPRATALGLSGIHDYSRLGDEDLARRYGNAIMGGSREAIRILAAVRSSSVRRHLIDKRSWMLLPLIPELLAVLPDGPDKNYALRTWGTLSGGNARWGITEESLRTLQTLAASDPQAAVRFLHQCPGITAEGHLQLLDAIITISAEHDRVRTAELADSIPEEARPVFEERCRREISSKPISSKAELVAATQCAVGLRWEVVRHEMMKQIATAYPGIDVMEATAWGASLADEDFAAASPNLVTELLEGAVIREASDGRLEACWPGTVEGSADSLTSLADRYVAARDTGPVQTCLLHAWLSRAPAEAAVWIEKTAQRDIHFEVLMQAPAEQLLRSWMTTDSLAASAWVESLPRGRLRDSSSFGIAGSIASEDPAAAFAWANSIADDGMRKLMLTRLAWRETRDSEESAARLRKAGVSAADMQSVIADGVASLPPRP